MIRSVANWSLANLDYYSTIGIDTLTAQLNFSILATENTKDRTCCANASMPSSLCVEL